MASENDYQESYCHLHNGRIEYVRGGRKAPLMSYRIFDDNDEDAPEWVQVAWATGRLRVKSPSRFLVATGQGHLRTGVWGDYIVFDPNNWALSVCPVELARSFGLVSEKEGEQGMENGYSTDDEAWRERERLTLSSQARKDVTSMAKQMLRGKDRNHIARQLGVKEPTFKSKVNDGRFTAPEFVALAYLCGFEVKLEDKYQTILGVLE